MTTNGWQRIRVPTLQDPITALPPDGDWIVLWDGTYYLARFDGETMSLNYDDGTRSTVGDMDGAYWHPLPPAPRGESEKGEVPA